MESSTTIRRMMANNTISVPDYQRAYSWDTPNGRAQSQGRDTQTDVFLSDIEEHKDSATEAPFHFGHFLFKQGEKDGEYLVIDGQQRLTTIVIFVSALYAKLRESDGNLSDDDEMYYEDVVQRRNKNRFRTVAYDNQFLIDYVIDGSGSGSDLDTESKRRIAEAYDFFKRRLSIESKDYLMEMRRIVGEATCTTHLVQDDPTAVQMFIFQNSRGKQPTALDVVKAQFMYNVHLHGSDENGKEELLEEIRRRFETIHRSIASIEYRISEDDVLLYTLRVYHNSLWESNALDRINRELAASESPSKRLDFIRSFSRSLADSFGYLTLFFGRDERESFQTHSLVALEGIAIALPFVIKAYNFDLPLRRKAELFSSLRDLVLRHRLIGTRADMTSRINDVFEQFTQDAKDATPIVDRIEWMKTASSESEWYWAYWNRDKLEESLQGAIHHRVARYLLWEYEIHLEQKDDAGYSPTRFEKIERPEVEHIAPVTEPDDEAPHGYDEYDEEFRQQYLDCLGNYLLISKEHNCSIGNVPFAEKLASYKHLEQQREIRAMVGNKIVWDRKLIRRRKEKIVSFILDNL